jgi:hypothetical protein
MFSIIIAVVNVLVAIVNSVVINKESIMSIAIVVFAVIALIIVNELSRVAISNATSNVYSKQVEVDVRAQGQSIASVVKAVKDWTLVDTSVEAVVVKIDEYTLSTNVGTMTAYRVENATVVSNFGNRFVNTSAMVITYTRARDGKTVTYAQIGSTNNVEWFVRTEMLINKDVNIDYISWNDQLKVVYN